MPQVNVHLFICFLKSYCLPIITENEEHSWTGKASHSKLLFLDFFVQKFYALKITLAREAKCADFVHQKKTFNQKVQFCQVDTRFEIIDSSQFLFPQNYNREKKKKEVERKSNVV